MCQTHGVVEDVAAVNREDHAGDWPPVAGMAGAQMMQARHEGAPAANVKDMEGIARQDVREIDEGNSADAGARRGVEPPRVERGNQIAVIAHRRVGQHVLVERTVAEQRLDEVVIGDQPANPPFVLALFEEGRDRSEALHRWSWRGAPSARPAAAP
jgi:hypothetical protein